MRLKTLKYEELPARQKETWDKHSARRETVRGLSPELLDDADEFVGLVAVGAGVVEKFFRLFDDGAVLGCAGDGDAAAAAEFEEPFVAELAECAQDGVGVDAEHGGEVFGGWESFARFGFALGDGAAELGGDLLVEVEGVLTVELDRAHGASHYSFIRLGSP